MNACVSVLAVQFLTLYFMRSRLPVCDVSSPESSLLRTDGYHGRPPASRRSSQCAPLCCTTICVTARVERSAVAKIANFGLSLTGLCTGEAVESSTEPHDLVGFLQRTSLVTTLW
ncbi:hypothetical protein PR002_g22856 [Phytophthora rubi]|uniref:Secreted protein n=1 Tax=Phytophthora rubi TaxID=129364 RepID=A0A6A3IRJ4_9STRA|nr:hypothetical protein PR002_g22856 [Phytophthora rubi]